MLGSVRWVLGAGCAALLGACGGQQEAPPQQAAGSSAAATSQASKKPCPDSFDTASAGISEPNVDILGIRPGMSFAEVEHLLSCEFPELTREVGDYHTTNFEKQYHFASRQHLRATDGRECSLSESESDRQSGGGSCTRGGLGAVEPRTGWTQRYDVIFSGLPGKEVAYGVFRDDVFEEGSQPSIEDMEQKIFSKYGPPNRTIESLGGKEIVHKWVYTPDGTLFEPEDRHLERCGRNVGTDARGRLVWSNTCGLTIAASFRAARGNDLLLRHMSMGLLDQGKFFHAVKEFEVAAQLERERLDAERASAEKSSASDVEL